jgi:hypothetical protein
MRKGNFKKSNLAGANLAKIDLQHAVFDGAILSESSLGGASLIGASFLGCDLKGSHLDHAECWSTNFRGSNLSNASMRYSQFIKADLARCDLSATQLEGCLFDETYLDYADFGRATLDRTTFNSADLSKILNLDSVVHFRQSSLSSSSIVRSRGKLPIQFLRGCGLTDMEINFARLCDPGLAVSQIDELLCEMNELRTELPLPKYGAFISYSHADKEFARRLHDAIQDRGFRCWLDEHELLPGDDLHNEIDIGITLSQRTLLLCSEKSLNSWWVDKEIEKAIQKEERLWNEGRGRLNVLIPIDLDGYLFGWSGSKASILKARNVSSFRETEEDLDAFNREVGRLVLALKK